MDPANGELKGDPSAALRMTVMYVEHGMTKCNIEFTVSEPLVSNNLWAQRFCVCMFDSAVFCSPGLKGSGSAN